MNRLASLTIMHFKKYNSIENSYREAFLKSLRAQGFDNDEHEYVVQEKVHGANLSFRLDGDGRDIRTAKRSGVIEEGEKFCSYERVRDRLKNQLRAVFAKVKNRFPETELVTIYGELFGGVYSHPDVKDVKNVSRVQKGIDYHPDVRFYAFDILVNNETYLPVDVANEMFEAAGLLYARTLFRGSLTDALAYPNDFDSKIGEWLGLPSIEGNTCEGVVIRPVEALFLSGGRRVILKNKNQKWEENCRTNKSHEIQLTADAAGLQKALKGYLTTNRVQNVISKIGDVSMKDVGKIMHIFMPDALEDFKKDHGEAWDTLEKTDRKAVTAGLHKYGLGQVRKVLNDYE